MFGDPDTHGTLPLLPIAIVDRAEYANTSLFVSGLFQSTSTGPVGCRLQRSGRIIAGMSPSYATTPVTNGVILTTSPEVPPSQSIAVLLPFLTYGVKPVMPSNEITHHLR